jgi:cytochrome c oxidase subunit III
MIASARPVIDVSRLPDSALDHRALIWWGNLLLLGIETTMFALLLGAYFYVQHNFQSWPPVHVDGPLGRYHSVPALGIPLVSLGVLFVTLAPMIWADRACLRREQTSVALALVIFIVLAAGCIALRFLEFRALHFRWDDNAYASIVWTILGMHLLHLFVGTLEMVIMLVWILRRGLDDKHARDVRVTAAYWYWVVGVWVVLFSVVFLGPRVF